MDSAAHIPGFTKTDRLGLTAFVSVLTHMTVILGVGFAVPDLRSNDPLPALDITLVSRRSDSRPDNADFLAQANQQGGGDTDQAVIAQSPLAANPVPVPDRVAVNQPSAQPEPRPQERQVLTRDEESDTRLAERRAREPREKSPPADDTDAERNRKVAAERARLSAEISQFWQEYQKRPRRKFISARTREYKYAEYMATWRTRVERVGNLNYPDKARRQSLTGNLVMDVAIAPDGSVHNLDMVQSSGNKVLDDAARRIVRLAAPFEAFPEDIREEVDILHITRTWQFLRGNRLVSR